MAKRRRKQRQSLAGSKWRVKGPVEDSILSKVADYIGNNNLGDRAFQFIFSMMNNASKSISVRQKWYLAFLASKAKVDFDQVEAEWINDVLSQECPEGFTQKKPYLEKPVKPASPVLLGAQRKIRQ